jgi:predicted MFS family arabinose efflux permease
LSPETKLWFAITGVAVVATLIVCARLARRSGNNAILKTGLAANAVILSCEHVAFPHHPGWKHTTVTYSFTPQSSTVPIEVTRQLDGIVELTVGSTVQVKYLPSHPEFSLLVPFVEKYDAF